MSPELVWIMGLLLGLTLGVPLGLLLSHRVVPFFVDVAVAARERRK